MKYKLSHLLLIFFFLQSGNLFSQHVSRLLPTEYIKQQKIMKIIEYKMDPKDSMPYTEEFYPNGLKLQRSSYHLKNLKQHNMVLDTNNTSPYIIFYESYIYDNKNRCSFTSASWTGQKNPYIMMDEFSYSNDGDTTYSLRYNDAGEKSKKIWHISHDYIADTLIINPNFSIFRTRSLDTVGYKLTYKNANQDSIVYKYPLFECTDYYVYNGKVLTSSGFIYTKEVKGKKVIWSTLKLIFDDNGYPYEAYSFWFNEGTKRIKIHCEKFKLQYHEK